MSKNSCKNKNLLINMYKIQKVFGFHAIRDNYAMAKFENHGVTLNPWFSFVGIFQLKELHFYTIPSAFFFQKIHLLSVEVTVDNQRSVPLGSSKKRYYFRAV